MLIVPNLIAGYITANFTETETAWVNTTPYSYGDEARDGHYIYKSLVPGSASNTGNQPSISPLHWIQDRPSNYWAMLDGVTLTQTSVSDNIIVEVASVNYDAIAMLNMYAKSVSIEMTDLNTGTVVFTDTEDLTNTSSIVDFLSYCFEPFEYKTTYYKRIPPYGNAKIKVTVENTGGTAKCGTIVAGRSIYLGEAEWGVGFEMESWSRKTVDPDFGITSLEHTNSVFNDTYTINVPSDKLQQLKRVMKNYDFTPVLFVGDESDDSRFENLADWGYWETIRMVLEGPVRSKIDITKKGLI